MVNNNFKKHVTYDDVTGKRSHKNTHENNHVYNNEH